MPSNVVDDSNITAMVVGATGATGHHVVQMLLDKGHSVRVIVRSKSKMMGMLKGDEASYKDNLVVVEAPLLELTDEQLKEHAKDCQVIISCLGHNLSVQGLWGHPRRLVADSVKRLTDAMPKDCKFILMNSDGVAHPDGKTDPDRPLTERTVLFMLRYMVPPHADNEAAALYLYEQREKIPWCIVRPTDLVDGDVKEYELYDSPPGSLFGSGSVTKASVAAFMTELATDAETWDKYKHKMPVLHNTVTAAAAAKGDAEDDENVETLT
mmetsp:Transcript_23240/g.65849  ORF Transcript_23240/g.65849 Transcript_23240/m.65849 type:complete len:267 (-) Transcript_23240:157-957(-)